MPSDSGSLRLRADDTSVSQPRGSWVPSSGRYVFTTLYYLMVLVGLLVLYGRGEFSPAGFIYQAF